MITKLQPPSEDQYLNCIRCGLCLAVCPTYREHLSETASPRGRVALARKSLEGELELTPRLIKQMYACLDCLACNEACPVGIRPADLALEMRTLQESRRPAAWKQAVFDGLVANPARLEAATLPMRLYERLGLRRLGTTLGVQQRLPKKIRDLEAMLPRLPARPLRAALPEITPSQRASRYRLGFFLGCAQSLLFAEQSAASLRVLSRNGCTVIVPRQQVCCGMPAAEYGRPDLAQAQARHNIALYEAAQVETIVTDCATCGAMLKGYARLLAADSLWAPRAEAFSRKVQDISEFLAAIPLEKPARALHARVTYHDPCHLRRGQGVWKQPRRLLQMIDGVELVELPEADWCCGSAGSQLLTHYQTSSGVLERKTANIASTGASYVVSGCPACQMQLQAGIRRAGLEMQVAHPVTLLDQAYHGDA
jgi:glycolate oxidase iron-sulfur subunit